MNFYSWLILFFILGTALLDTTADLLNLRHMSLELPNEFKDIYDSEKYRVSLQYQKENIRFETLKQCIWVPLTLIFIFAGGFNAVDIFARSLGLSSLGTGLIFVGGISLLRSVVQLPFSIFHTFVIEEKYGFNRTTPQLFLSDLIKGLVLSIVLGAPVFAGIQWFFESQGADAWWISWAALTAFQLVLVFLAPVILMPLFNRFLPLPDGALKDSIKNYAHSAHFQLQGIYTMDGSKRSTKANAFFTGFGPFRRLVLFDTLIEKQTAEELTAVMAHEVGHFKRGHILKSLALSIAVSAAMFYALGWALGNGPLFEAFQMQYTSVYGGLILASFLYSPAFQVLSIFTHWLSRRHEFEADRFAAQTYGHPEFLVSALKKLSIDHLSNLTPHPFKVWLEYTHPPILQRIAALRKGTSP
ncbi:M48 family metallopeptidase [Bdellovibrionota bacterium FG-1]